MCSVIVTFKCKDVWVYFSGYISVLHSYLAALPSSFPARLWFHELVEWKIFLEELGKIVTNIWTSSVLPNSMCIVQASLCLFLLSLSLSFYVSSFSFSFFIFFSIFFFSLFFLFLSFSSSLFFSFSLCLPLFLPFLPFLKDYCPLNKNNCLRSKGTSRRKYLNDEAD